jgi:hypothetical protein
VLKETKVFKETLVLVVPLVPRVLRVDKVP